LCLAIADAGSICETPCQTFNDCNSLELCTGGYCASDSCPASESFESCPAGNGGDGFCVPASETGGLCFPPGSADGGCDPATTGAPWMGWNAVDACGAGTLCVPLDAGGTCLTVCSPGLNCLRNDTCIALEGDPFTGVCVPCPANQISCGLECFDPMTDDLHCGGGLTDAGSCSEGSVCAPDAGCVAGSCS
jgi:hypothetical protein